MSLPEACNFIKKETLAQMFSVNFAKLLRTPFSQNTSGGCFLHHWSLQPYLLQTHSEPSRTTKMLTTFVTSDTCRARVNLISTKQLILNLFQFYKQLKYPKTCSKNLCVLCNLCRNTKFPVPYFPVFKMNGEIQR